MTDLVKRHKQWKSNKELCREPTGEFVLEAKDMKDICLHQSVNILQDNDWTKSSYSE